MGTAVGAARMVETQHPTEVGEGGGRGVHTIDTTINNNSRGGCRCSWTTVVIGFSSFSESYYSLLLVINFLLSFFLVLGAVLPVAHSLRKC